MKDLMNYEFWLDPGVIVGIILIIALLVLLTIFLKSPKDNREEAVDNDVEDVEDNVVDFNKKCVEEAQVDSSYKKEFEKQMDDDAIKSAAIDYPPKSFPAMDEQKELLKPTPEKKKSIPRKKGSRPAKRKK